MGEIVRENLNRMEVGEMSNASLLPDDFGEGGGGLLDNVDVEWVKCAFVEWDYNGAIPNPVPALCVTLLQTDSGDETDQYWSAGSMDHLQPSENGCELVPQYEGAKINSGTKLAILMRSLVAAEFPVDAISPDCTCLEGMKCRMVQQDAPKRTGMVDKVRADGKVFKKTDLVVDEIYELPGGGKGGGKKGEKAKAGGKGAKAEKAGKGESGESVEERAAGAIMEAIKGAKKPMEVKAVASAVHKLGVGTDVVKKVLDEGFLSDPGVDEALWLFENNGKKKTLEPLLDLED